MRRVGLSGNISLGYMELCANAISEYERSKDLTDSPGSIVFDCGMADVKDSLWTGEAESFWKATHGIERLVLPARFPAKSSGSTNETENGRSLHPLPPMSGNYQRIEFRYGTQSHGNEPSAQELVTAVSGVGAYPSRRCRVIAPWWADDDAKAAASRLDKEIKKIYIDRDLGPKETDEHPSSAASDDDVSGGIRNQDLDSEGNTCMT